MRAEKIAKFSNDLSKDANGLSNVLYEYIAEWMKKFPEFQTLFAKNQSLLQSRIPEELRELKINNKGLEY